MVVTIDANAREVSDTITTTVRATDVKRAEERLRESEWALVVIEKEASNSFSSIKCTSEQPTAVVAALVVVSFSTTVHSV